MMFVDAHIHLEKYSDNELKELFDENINTIFVANSMDIDGYIRSKQISKLHKNVISTFGIHPFEAKNYSDNLEVLDKYINEADFIGEIGLDFYFEKDSSTYPKQIKVFEYFLEKAEEQQKSINLHTKGAEKEILSYLQEYNISNPIIHWYSGPLKYVDKLIEAGCYFTFGYELLVSKHIQKLLKKIPLDRMLTETDDPGICDWLKIDSKYCLKDILDKVSEIKGTSFKEVEEIIFANFAKIFKLESSQLK